MTKLYSKVRLCVNSPSLCYVPHPYGWLQVNLYMQEKRCPKAWDIILCEKKEIGTTIPLWSQGCQTFLGFE
jgi:hypothetical protein